MANPFSNLSSKIEQHPVMASVIVGGLALIVTIYYIKKNQSSQTAGATQPNLCTDSNGNIVDCTTGQPVGTSGGYSLQPTNDSADVLSAIGQLGQAFQNFVQTQNNPPVTNPPVTNPPVTNPPVTNPPVTNPPGGVNPPTNTGTPPTNTDISSATHIINYKVPSDGMSLNNIAAAFGIPETWLASWNRQLGNPDWLNKPWWNITAGTQVNIPYKGNTAPTFKGNVGSGPAIPVTRQVTVAQWSGTNTPWNSTLWGIASHFGESLTQIEKLNPQIKNPNVLSAGQKVNY